MELSNKTLAWLVVTTIVISMAGIMLSLNKLNQGFTGHATSNATGNVSVTVATQTVLQFAVSNITFGTGSVIGSEPNCTMWINGSSGTTINQTSGCSGFNTASPGTLVLENAGNTVINVTLNFSNNATSFIGGGLTGGASQPALMFSVAQNETSSCISLNTTTGNWTDAVANAQIPICNGLSWQNTNDTISIGIFVIIPLDATGSKNVNITAQGTG